MSRITRELVQICGQEPTNEELAQIMGLSVGKIEDLKLANTRTVSLQRPVKDDEATLLGDLIPDNSGPTVEENGVQSALREEVKKVLDTLTDRERRILQLRFGLEDKTPLTLEEVGREEKVTRERVRQIEAKALRKLRHPSRSKHLRDYLD